MESFQHGAVGSEFGTLREEINRTELATETQAPIHK